MLRIPFRAQIAVCAMAVVGCQADPGTNEQNGMGAENIADAVQSMAATTEDAPRDRRKEFLADLGEHYAESEMQNAFRSVFGKNAVATVQLPQMTSFGTTGKIIPFSIAPAAFEWTEDGAILVTAAASENDSAAMLPGSDLYYIGLYYLRPYNLGFKVKAAYPTALLYWGSDFPSLSRRFTGKPVLIAGGTGGFTWMGQQRYWDELYALKGGEPELIGIIPRSCGESDLKDYKKYQETSGSITEIRQNIGFTVRYKGDVSGAAKWAYRNGKFVLVARYPNICDHDYFASNREARESTPRFHDKGTATR